MYHCFGVEFSGTMQYINFGLVRMVYLGIKLWLNYKSWYKCYRDKTIAKVLLRVAYLSLQPLFES